MNSSPGSFRRTAALTAGVLVLAACGSAPPPEQTPATDPPPPVSDAVPVSAPEATSNEPADFSGLAPNTPVFEYSNTGGFTSREFAFRRTPDILVTADYMAYFPGVVTMEYPGPLLLPTFVVELGEVGFAELYSAASDAGLFTDIDYTENTLVADATTAVVAVRESNDQVWVHEAYALAMDPDDTSDDQTTRDRATLEEFIQDAFTISGQATRVGEPFVPDRYDVAAFAVDDLENLADDGLDVTVVEWPSAAAVRPLDATFDELGADRSCEQVDAESFADVFESADELTFFSDADVTYQVLVRPTLPGQNCSQDAWYR